MLRNHAKPTPGQGYGNRKMSEDMKDVAAEITAIFTEREVRLFLGPRPGKKSLDTLAGLNLTHCCTLLSEREDVQPIRRICQKLGCAWVWLPIEGGRLDVLRQTDIAAHLQSLIESVASEPEPRIYFHCSAGIHWTGFFVYLLLRLRGYDRDEASEALTKLRPVTAEQVGEERLDLADEMLAGQYST